MLIDISCGVSVEEAIIGYVDSGDCVSNWVTKMLAIPAPSIRHQVAIPRK